MAAVPWKGFVDDVGNFSLDKRQEFIGWIKNAKRLHGKEVILTLREMPKRQGSQSMRYYRGVVIPDIAEACGYADPDDWADVHDGLAWKFLRLPDGEFGNPRRRSTSKDDMSQEEMTTYIDQVIVYAETSIPGCVVRRPHEVDMDSIVDPEWK